MKKILFAISTLNGGGAERVVSVWTGQLVEAGYDVYIVLFGHVEGEYEVNKKVKVYTVADTYDEYKHLSYPSKISKMRKIVRKIHPDITINFLPRVQIIMLISTFGLGIRSIETVRVSPWELTDDNKLAEIAWRICFWRASKIIIQTNEQGEFFGKKERRKCVVIPNPLSDAYLNVRKKNYSDHIRRFVAAGRIDKQKNYVMMINAFADARARLEEEAKQQGYIGNEKVITLDIFGSGNELYEKTLSNLIEEKNLTDIVRLVGRSNCLQNELVKYDAFLMSSDYEGMPNALAEAMAVGLVCISTDCRTGPKDMIEDGVTGFLAKLHDEKSFADIIVKVCQMKKNDAEEVGKKAAEAIRVITSKEKSLRRLIELVDN